MHYVKQFHINGVDTKQIACIELHGAPNAATEGAVGVLGMDVTSPTHEVYRCVAVNGAIYTWELLSAGMSIMSSTISGRGDNEKTFSYTSLRVPDGYLIKVGDLIFDSEGYLYRVTAIGASSCSAEYCGTHISGGSGDIINNLTGTTWVINEGFSAAYGYGKFDVNYIYNGNTEGTSLYIGFEVTTNSPSGKPQEGVITTLPVDVEMGAGDTITITGGADVTNADLIDWLKTNATTEAPTGATFIPHVSEEGVLSWTNDGGFDNPEPVNIKGADGKDGADGANGKDGTSVTVSSVSESTADGGSNVVTFSDGKKLTIKNGSKGTNGTNGKDYVLTEADKSEIATMVLSLVENGNGVAY